MKWVFLKTIRLYQRYLSFDTGMFFKRFKRAPVCKFHPTCSEYSYQAIDSHGAIKGSVLGCKRIMRCHPWADGGVDYVPQKKV